MHPYRYRSLREGNVRLLRLLPHQDRNFPMRCRLFSCPLPDTRGQGGTGLYEALSYAWGSSEKPRSICIGESIRNLDDASDNDGG